jgi:hypothetical protein
MGRREARWLDHAQDRKRMAAWLPKMRGAPMNPHFSDSEARTILNARKMQRDAEWLRGVIGDETYIASLMILGYKPKKEAETELNLLRMSR